MGRKSGHHPHKNDRYVTGGTNWDSYALPQLIAMVNDKVDIPALVRLADDWRFAGDDVTESAKDLAGALDRLMDFWSGDAAEQARCFSRHRCSSFARMAAIFSKTRCAR